MLASLLAATLAAGEDPARLHYQIVVEAAEASPASLDRTAASVTVLGEDDIRASGAVEVAELLRRVAGVDVTRPGSAGKVTTVRIDGAASTQTLVLVDGVEINSPALGLADLADLTLDNVERIEVVRGPHSALHGSSAMGGIVHIRTRRGRGPVGGSAEVEAGAWSTWRAAAAVRGGHEDRVGWTVAASRTRTDGRRFPAASGPVENDAWEHATLSASLDLRLDGESALSLDARVTDAERGIPIEVFGAQAFDRNSTQADRTAVFGGRIATRWGRVRPWLRFGTALAAQDFRDPLDPGESGPFAADFSSEVDTRRIEVTGQLDVEAAGNDRLSVGGSLEGRHASSRDSFSGENFERTFESVALYAENRLDLESVLGKGDRLVVTAGARLDEAASFGSAFNPKLGLLWRSAGDGLHLRVAAGRGFRAPSLNELLFPFFGNPDLESERSWSFEAAAGARSGRLAAELRAFRSDYDRLITADPVTFTAINLDEARVEGLELELRAWPTRSLWLTASGTLQRAEDRRTGKDLIRRPERKGALAAGYERPGSFRVAADLVAVGDMADAPVAGFPERNPSWVRVNLSGAVTVPFGQRRFELFGRVENLFDADYSEALGYPAPGVNGRAGLRARF